MNDHSPDYLFKIRLEALKHPTRPLSVQRSKTPHEDLMAWYIRERYGPWTESQMLKYQNTVLRIERNFNRVMNRNQQLPKPRVNYPSAQYREIAE